MKIYNKVIRDKIPGMIEKSGIKYEIKELDDGRFLEGLKEKLVEELRGNKAETNGVFKENLFLIKTYD